MKSGTKIYISLMNFSFLIGLLVLFLFVGLKIDIYNEEFSFLIPIKIVPSELNIINQLGDVMFNVAFYTTLTEIIMYVVILGAIVGSITAGLAIIFNKNRFFKFIYLMIYRISFIASGGGLIIVLILFLFFSADGITNSIQNYIILGLVGSLGILGPIGSFNFKKKF